MSYQKDNLLLKEDIVRNSDMNSDIQPVKTRKTSFSKYEKLRKEANTQIYKHNNPDDFQVIHKVPYARQVFDNLSPEKPHEQKQKSNSNLTPSSYTSPSSTKNINPIAGRLRSHKLVDSKQVTGSFNQPDKKTFLLDTYARIVATNNRRCPKRLRELAKPKRQTRSDQNDCSANFDLNYGRPVKTYEAEIKRSLKESKKK